MKEVLCMDTPKLWTKDFVIIFGTNFFTHVVFYMLMVTVAIYTMNTFDASEGIAGLATGVFVLASLVARVFVRKVYECHWIKEGTHYRSRYFYDCYGFASHD